MLGGSTVRLTPRQLNIHHPHVLVIVGLQVGQRRERIGQRRHTDVRFHLAFLDSADGTVYCGLSLGCRIHSCCRVVVSNGRRRYPTTSGFGMVGARW